MSATPAVELDSAPGSVRLAAFIRARTGRGEGGRIAHWSFYLAFNMFRLAAIQQGIAQRAMEGNAANSRALVVAARVETTAQTGRALASRPEATCRPRGAGFSRRRVQRRPGVAGCTIE